MQNMILVISLIFSFLLTAPLHATLSHAIEGQLLTAARQSGKSAEDIATDIQKIITHNLLDNNEQTAQEIICLLISDGCPPELISHLIDQPQTRLLHRTFCDISLLFPDLLEAYLIGMQLYPNETRQLIKTKNHNRYIKCSRSICHNA